MSVTASGGQAGASIEANYGVYADSGDIGAVTVTAKRLSQAAIDGGSAGVYADVGSVGAVQVIASGSSRHEEISGGDYGVYADSSIGVSAPTSAPAIGSPVAADVLITASAAQASAEINGISRGSMPPTAPSAP